MHALALQVFGQVLLPGAAMLEAALSSAYLLLDGASLGSAAGMPVLAAISMPSPLALSARGQTALECVVSMSSTAATVSIQSTGSSSSSPAVTHMRGSVVKASGNTKFLA